MVLSIPSNPNPYKLAQYVGAFIILSHWRLPKYPYFLRDNLKVTQYTPIPTSYFRGYSPIRRNKSYKTNSSLAVTPNFINIVRFNLTVPGSWLQKLSMYALQVVIINLSYYGCWLSISLTFMYQKWYRYHCKYVSIWLPDLNFSYIIYNPPYNYPNIYLPYFGK